ncbi:MAG: cell division protein ZapA [Crocinitomicaceae bacterium]
MAKVSLKVVVAGRTYPLTLNEEEKEKVLNAADEINKAIKLLQDNYAVKDMQDLLAMTALQLATKSKSQSTVETKVIEKEPDYSTIEESLEGLVADLNSLK